METIAELTSMFNSAEKGGNPKKAAQIAYAISVRYARQKDFDHAREFLQKSMSHFEKAGTQTLEQCAPDYTVLGGVVFPSLIHEGVVENRLGLMGVVIS